MMKLNFKKSVILKDEIKKITKKTLKKYLD